jgi:hypothetical protein
MRVQKDLYCALFVFVKRACVSKCTCLLSVIYVEYLCGKQKLVLKWCMCVEEKALSTYEGRGGEKIERGRKI